MKNFIQILKLLRNYKVEVALNVLFNILATIFSLFSLAAVAPLLNILFNSDHVTLPTQKPELSVSSDDLIAYLNYQFGAYILEHGARQTLLYFCLFIVVIFILKNITSYFTLYFIAPIRIGVVRDLRQAIHYKLLKLHLGYYSDERRGDILSRATSDVSEVETSIISSLEMIFRDPILIIVYLATMVFLSWQLTIFVLVLLPVSGVLISLIGRKLKDASRHGQSKLGEVINVLEETLGGLRIIQAFNAQAATHQRFTETNNTYHRLMVRLFRKQYLGSPLTEILSAITLAVLIFYGGSLVLNAEEGGFTGEFFITFILIFSQIVAPAKSFSQAYFKIQKGIASVERINAVLDAEEKIKEIEDPVDIKAFGNQVSFENISFRYSETPVISNLSLTINKGEKVAVVGPSGGGKSTMANLLPRFYDVDRGSIRIDGVDIRNISLVTLRGLFGIVSQDSILFNDTVANNIKLSKPDASEADIVMASKIANAYDFIMTLENGFSTIVGDGGNKLSGGQKQRLSIARAVLKDPQFLILDEATSALDTESERLVQDAINKLMQNRTSMVIAHRLSTIQHADKIVVVEDGKIAEQGSHSDLLTANGTYKKLHDMQSFQ